LSKSINYQEIDDPTIHKNLLIVGNIGNGKSTITNKLAGEDVSEAK
jgi:putative ribosome biogenesis GTPase RsgA